MKIIFITASWCPSCLLMRARLGKLLEGATGIEVEEVDIDENGATADAYAPGKILPVTIFIAKDGRQQRLIGETSVNNLARALRESTI